MGGGFNGFYDKCPYNLFGWLYWEDGCWMWFSSRYTLLRLLVNMNVFMVLFLVHPISMCNVYNLALRMFRHIGSLVVILGPLKMSEFVMLPFH